VPGLLFIAHEHLWRSAVRGASGGGMKIAVIGAGAIGRTLGGKWEAAGHEVVYGVRAPGAPGTASVAEAATGAEVVLLSLPGAVAGDVLRSLGTALTGKVVIDATNNLQGASLNALDALPEGAHGVRAFNSLGWENLADPLFAGVAADLFYAAEEGRAKDVAESLIADVGLGPVWVGGAESVVLVDSLTRLWLTLAFQRKLGRRLALKLLVGD
jgi:predicted dinucleotide-binding enzyme